MNITRGEILKLLKSGLKRPPVTFKDSHIWVARTVIVAGILLTVYLKWS